MKQKLLVAAVCLLLAKPLLASEVLVVCPTRWQGELKDWAAMRAAQGRTLTIVDPAATLSANLNQVREAYARGDLRFVVLVGDAGRPGTPPCARTPLKILSRWGPETTVATDHPYADLAGDAAPEIAVGRIPCRTAQELRAYLERVVAYETRPSEPPPDSELAVVASPGNFSPWLDRVMEQVATRALQESVPRSIDLRVVSAAPTSPHFPGRDRLHDAVAASYRRRALAWVYLGHALPNEIDRAPSPVGLRSLLDAAEARRAAGGASPPVACLIACYAGAFDAKNGCLAEAMLSRPTGPLAVIAASRVTMPYGNSLIGLALLESLFDETRPTPVAIGDAVRAAKRTVLRSDAAPRDRQLRATIESIAAGLTSDADRRRERLEHVLAYHVLGDPLLTSPPPRATALEELAATKNTGAGQAARPGGVGE